MYSYSKFVKHIFIVGSIDLLGIAQTMIFLPIITKLLGAGDYGIWSQVKTTMSLLLPFTLLGLQEAIVRFIPGEKDARKIQEGIYASLFIVLAINLLMASALLIFSGPISNFLRFSPVFIKLLGLIIVFESLNTVLFIVVRAFREIEKYFWLMTLKMFGETGLVIAAVLLGYGLYGAVVSFLLIRITVFVILFIYTLKKIGIIIPKFSLVKDYLRFGLPTIADGAAYWVITSVDRYFIGFFWGIVFVGYYSPAYAMGTLVTLFLFPILFMLSTILPKFFDENKLNEVKNYLSHSLKYFLAVAIPATFGVSVLAKELLIVLSTREISDAAFLVVPVITVSIFLYGVTCFFIQILGLVKKTKTIALIWIAGAAPNFILNIFFIPRFGIMAAAFTTLASYFCCFLLVRYFASKEFTFKVEWGFIAKSALSSLIMSLFIIWFNLGGLLGLALSIILGAIIYGIFIFLFKGFGKKEIIFLKKLAYEMAFSAK